MNKRINGNTEIWAHEKLKGRGATWHPVQGLALPPRGGSSRNAGFGSKE